MMPLRVKDSNAIGNQVDIEDGGVILPEMGVTSEYF